MKIKYYLFDGDEYIGIFSRYEIAMMINCNHKTVEKYAQNGTKYQGRYTFQRINADLLDLLEEWDTVRINVLKKLGESAC